MVELFNRRIIYPGTQKNIHFSERLEQHPARILPKRREASSLNYAGATHIREDLKDAGPAPENENVSLSPAPGERPMREVTFKDFQKLMIRRRRTVDDLIDIFRGKLDDSRGLFERVMSCQWRNPDTGRFEDRGDVVIPYKSVIEFYLKELHYLEDSKRRPMKVSDHEKMAIPSREFIGEF